MNRNAALDVSADTAADHWEGLEASGLIEDSGEGGSNDNLTIGAIPEVDSPQLTQQQLKKGQTEMRVCRLK